MKIKRNRSRKMAWLLVVFHWSLVTHPLLTLVGCESLEKKFTRKPKMLGRPSPIVQFQDYSQAMTPMDRYRKHYAIFDYWNAELLNALSGGASSAVSSQGPMNEKRVKRASADALSELRAVQSLVAKAIRPTIDALVDERAALDQQLQAGSLSPFSADRVRHALEIQTRQIHRDLYWRTVQDKLK